MTKRMLIMLIGVGLLFGGIFAYKAFVSYKLKKSMSAYQAPPVAVSATEAKYLVWQPQLSAVGSLRAVRGVDVTSEIAGLVQKIYFSSGDEVKEGKLLLQLNADSDIALLHSLEAAAELANTVYERDRKQYAVQAVSKAALDADAADLKVKRAQVAQQAAIVIKKSIHAPFAGKLGISTVNPGQYINPGDKIVTLQSLDLIYLDFYLPQQDLPQLSLGQRVIATTDSYPGRRFTGKITTVNPKVDTNTRNIQVEATIENPAHKLLPGMYAALEVHAGATKRYLTLPQTAITYNPYGDTVFVVEKSGKGPGGQAVLTVRQAFVTVGPRRGDQVAILEGVREGETVVTSGQLKLKNGSRVIINNQIQPTNEAAPTPPNE
jgi:membrane fusion protein (multidrug efflux system)